MAIYGQGGQQPFGFQPQGCYNPFGMGGNMGNMSAMGGFGFPGMMGSPFGMGGGGNPMQQMMQTMMQMMMGMMANQMMQQMQQMMQQGGGQPFGQFAPGMNPCFGAGGGMPNMMNGGGGNGMGNFLGCGCNGPQGNNGNYNNGGNNGGPQGSNGNNGGNYNGGGPNTMSPPSSTGQIDHLSANRNERLQQVVDAAKRTYPDQPHMAKLAAAQACLESGIASQKGPSGLASNHNNLFGIKGRGTAGSANMRTGEHLNGRDVTINADFAANRTVEDSFQQHKSLMSRPRYRKVMQSQSFEQAAHEVKAAGYATAPNYSDSLISVYNQQLARYF